MSDVCSPVPDCYFRTRLSRAVARRWSRAFMRISGIRPLGRIATRLAALPAPPHNGRIYLSQFHPEGYVAPGAVIHHGKLNLGRHPFVDEGAMIYRRRGGGFVRAGRQLRLYRHAIMETGWGGTLELGDWVSIHPRCQINAYVSSIRIGDDVMLAPNCAIYSYDHGIAPGVPISKQPLTSSGDVEIGAGAWLGFGAIVLGGVRIGEGAVVGAGAVVTRDVPANAVAAGSPARVIRYRGRSMRWRSGTFRAACE